MSLGPEPPPHWPISIQFLHWATVLALAGLFASGWNPGAHGISSLHVTLGVLSLAIVIARVATRLVTSAPPPLTRNAVVRWGSWVNQLVLYMALLGAIGTGLAAFSPHPFVPHAKLFGIVELPTIPRLTPELRRSAALSHVVLVWLLLLAAASHVAAIFGHVFATDRSAIRRMLGGGTRRSHPNRRA